MGRSDCCAAVCMPSHEFRFGFPCEGTINDWLAVDARGSRESGRDEGDKGAEGDDGWLSFFLKNLPNIFFGPLVGVELISECMIVGADGDGSPAEESERADELGVWDPSVPLRLGVNCWAISWWSSMLVRLLEGGIWVVKAGLDPNISTGSSTASPRISRPRFWNFATFASVPASTMILVMTLCAWRL